MQLIWDKDNSRTNFAKPEISFLAAWLVSEDPLHIGRPDGVIEGEERRRTMGLTGAAVVVLGSVYTQRRGRRPSLLTCH